MKKILVITGPTATGKTALGLELADKYNGEIISADSRQIYKHMDIGTGKDTQHFQWGIDLVEPGVPFSVSDWVNYAAKTLENIWSRGKLPIVVGGTGQYIKELLNPSQTLHIPPDEKLREQLAGYSVGELQTKLREIDPGKWERMNESDRNNPRRLVRAIEVAVNPGPQGDSKKSDFDVLIIGLTAPMEFLEKRIDKRVGDRLKAGMEKERKELEKYKLPDTIGYHGETEEEWKRAEHAYARRQMVYLKKHVPGINWFDVSAEAPGYPTEEIAKRVAGWYIG